jgi:PhnB protein
MLKVADGTRVVAAAVDREARLVDPPHGWEHGERQATIDDPFGHQWVLNPDDDRRRAGAVGWETP